MTLTATLQLKLDGGAPQTGGVTATAGQSVQMTAASKAGWRSAEWQIWQYPSGFALPAGWTDTGDDPDMPTFSFFGVADPDPFVASAGPFRTRLIVNGGEVEDESTFLRVNYPGGLHPIVRQEEGQFTNAKNSVTGSLNENFAAIDALVPTVADDVLDLEGTVIPDGSKRFHRLGAYSDQITDDVVIDPPANLTANSLHAVRWVGNSVDSVTFDGVYAFGAVDEPNQFRAAYGITLPGPAIVTSDVAVTAWFYSPDGVHLECVLVTSVGL